MSTGKYKHMSEEDRIEIEDCLRCGVSFKDIGKRIGKDQTTVSKEVKKHIVVMQPAGIIAGMEPEPCRTLLKPPFVCNGCRTRFNCGLEKHYYRGKAAQQEYRETLTESRQGLPLTKEQFFLADEILTEGLKKGQHIYHITQSHDLGMSVSTVYRNMEKGYFSAGKMDLPRAVKFKSRRSRKDEYVPKILKKGRTFQDFRDYCSAHDVDDWIEMDTVIGVPGGKVIMTFLFTSCSFMFGLLLNDKTAAEAAERVRSFKKRLSDHNVSFGSLFPVILTDNGGEFSRIHAFEDDLNGNHETNLFFCDPYRSCQKPQVEKNHSLFRDIVPKGYSFDRFSQEDVDLIFSNVNSVKRKRLNQKTPFELFSFLYGSEQLTGAELAGLLGIEPIHPFDVVQSPRLLKQLPSLSK